jgi:hypothetical protein
MNCRLGCGIASSNQGGYTEYVVHNPLRSLSLPVISLFFVLALFLPPLLFFLPLLFYFLLVAFFGQCPISIPSGSQQFPDCSHSRAPPY